MTGAPLITSNSATDAELRRFVEESVSAFRGQQVRLKHLQRAAHEYSSSFKLERLEASFEDGTSLQFILKDVGPDGMLPSARRIRPTSSGGAHREIDVYRRILANASLGTATYYGAFGDGGRGWNWLLLEKVEGEELYQIGDFEYWCAVARWLARMHDCLVHVANDGAWKRLLEAYNEGYWNGWIDRALIALKRRSRAGEHAVASSELLGLERQCRRAARHVGELPSTFIHGEFYPSNILIEQRASGPRICPIDWETAAIGSGLFDLAALTAGNWSEEHTRELILAYYNELPQARAIWPNVDAFAVSLRFCRMLIAMKWLGWCDDWQPPAEHRFDWLQEAVRMAQANAVEDPLLMRTLPIK